MIGKARLIALVLLSTLPGFIKIPLYRIVFGAKIGKRVKIGFGCVLVFKHLDIGDHSRIGPLSLFRVEQLKLGVRCRIGMLTRVIAHVVQLGPSVTVGPQVSILADDKDPRCVFSADAESWIFEYCYINPARPIRLGRNVGVGGGSYMFTHGFWLPKLAGYPVGYGEINIGNDVWLPWGCFIMPGVSIGDGAVIGARSLVTKDVPAGALAAGSPAKVLREQVAVDPGIPAKIAILEESSSEFAARHGKSLSIERLDDWVVIGFDSVPKISVATGPVVGGLPDRLGDTVAVVHERLRDLAHRPDRAFSLTSYQCTARSSFDSMQAAWLAHLRLIGTRHYPVDEVDVEGPA